MAWSKYLAVIASILQVGIFLGWDVAFTAELVALVAAVVALTE